MQMRGPDVIREQTDVAILGAGFSGSLLALMLARQRDVVLLERGRHPRFALGESSTPLANLALEEISRDFDLPWLLPLAEYGTWKQTYPDIPVGLKRGFTFAKHHAGRAFEPDALHRNELLVAASPADAVADTQWLRADFDHFLVQKVLEAGLPYHDRTSIGYIDPGPPWKVTGHREGERVEITARFLVDASGAGGALARSLGIPTEPTSLVTYSWAVFSHFEGVERWHDVVAEAGGRVDDYPYRADDAALHHILDEGWMYVLGFDNGVTSAGFLVDGWWQYPDRALTPEQQWQRLLDRYPSVARHLRGARLLRPIERTGRLQRQAQKVIGKGWALLAPAAYTMDALFSTGNAHSLMTMQRLARILIEERGREAEALESWYARALKREIAFVDLLVSTAYSALRCFPLFAAWTMYYFAGAIAAEERRRQGKAEPREEFLSSHLEPFRQAVMAGSLRLEELALGEPSAADVAAFEDRVARDIAPINTTGLCDRAKRNLYPYS
jgi:FADH2 O2-dependent halogenase